MRSVERQLALLLVDTGLTVAQFRILLHIAQDAPLSPTVLSAALAITKASMTVQLKALERAGLVEVHPDPVDRRASLVRLSRVGRRRLDITLRNIAVVEKCVDRRLLESMQTVNDQLSLSIARRAS